MAQAHPGWSGHMADAVASRAGMGRAGTGRDGMGRDGTGRDGMGRAGDGNAALGESAVGKRRVPWARRDLAPIRNHAYEVSLHITQACL